MSFGVIPKQDTDPGGAVVAPLSAFDALKKRRQQLEQGQTRDFALPGYESLEVPELGDAALVARYRRMGVDEYRQALFRTYNAADTDNPAGLAEVNAEFIIDALTGLYWRVEDRTIPIIDGQDSGWHDLAPLIGTVTSSMTAPQMVLMIFGGDEIALSEHAGDVGSWMQEGHLRADERLLGES